MSLSKLPILVALFGLSGAAHAQKLQSVAPEARTFTTVDAFGNVVRATTDASPAATAAMAAESERRNRGRGRDRGRDDRVRYGGGYYVPPVPYYPYGAPVYNNYYPALPSTTILGTPAYSWSRPATITNIPLGTYYGGYPAPAYPGYGYGYPAPAYGYPAYGQPTYGQPVYGQPAYPYPGVPYPAYGTTTTIYGAGTGTVYSQSQSKGYGVTLGNGGISVQLGNRQSSSSTTVTTR